MVKFGIGQPITRVEDQRLLTGKGRYTDDVKSAQALRGFVLRSPHANAKFAKIDTSAAQKAPGVHLVLSYADVKADGIGDIPCFIPIQNRDGSSRPDTPRPILANGQVRHVGDPVAFIVADSLEQARDAAELIDIDYEILPAVAYSMDAAKPGAPLVWDHVKGNQNFDWELGDAKATDAAFAKAHRVVKLELVNNRIVVNSMEPRGALAEYDAATERTSLFQPSQGVNVLLMPMAGMVLKIDPAKLRIVSGDVGGGFGMKIFLYPEPCLTVWASRKLKRAVKWMPDRSEAFMSDTQGRDHVSFAEMALDKDSHFLGLRVTTYANLGAYLSNYGPFIPTGAGTTMLAGLYKTPAIYCNVKGMLTNTVPTDAYRGAGRPEAAYLIERFVDHIAREVGLAPDELRRRNFIPASAMPFTTAFADIYDSGDFVTVMSKAMERADWKGIGARREEAKKRGKLRGIGMATYVERCSGGQPETAVVKFNPDDTLTIYIGCQTNGQGHETVYTQIMSDKLGLDPARIKVVQGDSDLVPMGMTGGSRAVPVGGAAVMGAAANIVDKGKLVASHVLEAAAGDIEYADGVFRIAGTDRSASLFDVAKAARDPKNLPAGATPGLDDSFTRTPEANTFPNGCHICELDIDAETGMVEIVRYTVVDDFGRAINPLLLQGQVHGGIVQGVGQALTEHTVYDKDSAQLLSGTFTDYAVPRADQVPSFDFSMHNVECTTNPLGIKGAGEAGAIGAPPAVINALVDVLSREVGLKHIDMPATPDVLWKALQARKGKAA